VEFNECRKSAEFVSLTPKGARVYELEAEGMSFDAALEIADSEYSRDGLGPRPGAGGFARAADA